MPFSPRHALLLALLLSACVRADHVRRDRDRPRRPTTHEAFALDASAFPADFDRVSEPTRPADDRPEITVYGYWPYWGDPLDTIPWDQLTHVAIFDVTLTEDGSLTDLEHWTDHAADALSLAEPHDVHVHLTVTSFDDDVMRAVLLSEEARQAAVAAIAAQVDAYGAHGVNVDFEGLPLAAKAAFVLFIQELSLEVGEVFLAMPAVDWAGAYDFDQLSQASDGLFLMGYDYHYAGGDPGPVAPLDRSLAWGRYSLAWTVDDYRQFGASDDRLILGLPLYGVDWPTVSTAVPGTRTGRGASVLYADAVAQAAIAGRQWNTDSSTPYAFPSDQAQLWYDDDTSLDAKIGYAIDEGLQGIGFWALTYDNHDDALWATVDAWTHPR